MASGPVYGFGGFELDSASRRLTREGAAVPLADRHLEVLLQLLAKAGTTVSKDALIEASWRGVAVTDNSLEQAISALRRALAAGYPDEGCIETVPRQGYRFSRPVSRRAARASDDALDALLAPYRAWIEGRAAIETLERQQIPRARVVFERLLESHPDEASAHVGLANACALQFEMTRADEAPDAAALATAVEHAREACRLDAGSGEAWATLGFVLDRTGHRLDALAASRRAVTLEPDNWQHHFRHAYVSWGQERLRAAHRTLALLPGFPLAHLLAATVYVARQALDEAERELALGIAGDAAPVSGARFSSVALHWLHGLLRMSRGDEQGAIDALERELAAESSGHLYARECCANTWYAIGALRLRQRRPADAAGAFEQTLSRVARHPLARLGLAVSHAGGRGAPGVVPVVPAAEPMSVDAATLNAAALALAGHTAAAAHVTDAALAAAPPGNAGWLLAVEPLLHVAADPGPWSTALARLRARAA